MMDRRKFIKVGVSAIALAFAGGLEKVLPVVDPFEAIEAQIYAVKYPIFEEHYQKIVRAVAIDYQIPEYMLRGEPKP